MQKTQKPADYKEIKINVNNIQKQTVTGETMQEADRVFHKAKILLKDLHSNSNNNNNNKICTSTSCTTVRNSKDRRQQQEQKGQINNKKLFLDLET